MPHVALYKLGTDTSKLDKDLRLIIHNSVTRTATEPITSILRWVREFHVLEIGS